MARVPYVSSEELDPEYREYLEYEGKTLNVHRATGNNPEVMAALDDFLEALYEDAGLSDRERELVILTAATTIGSQYKWHNHVWLAKKLGVNEREIHAIARDDHSPFTEQEKALVSYARAVTIGRVTNPLHQEISEYFDQSTVVGVSVLASAYVAVGRVLDALGVDIEDGEDFVGWSPATSNSEP